MTRITCCLPSSCDFAPLREAGALGLAKVKAAVSTAFASLKKAFSKLGDLVVLGLWKVYTFRQGIPDNFKNVLMIFRNNETIMLAAVQKDGLALQFASNAIRGNVAIVEAARKQNKDAWKYASAELRRAEEREKLRQKTLQDLAKKGWWEVLRCASHELRNDPIIIRAAINQPTTETEIVNLNFQALGYASAELRGNEGFIREVVMEHGDALEFASPELRGNEALVRLAATQSGHALRYASDELRNNGPFVDAIVTQHYYAFRYAGNQLRHNREFSLKMVNKDIRVLEYLDKSVHDIVLEKVRENGLNLQYASEEYARNNREIVFAALEQNIKALQFIGRDVYHVVLQKIAKDDVSVLQHAGEKLCDDWNFVLVASRINGMALQYASEALRTLKQFMLDVLTWNGLCLQYVHNDFKNDVEIIVTALHQTQDALQYVPIDLRNHPEVLACFPSTPPKAAPQ